MLLFPNTPMNALKAAPWVFAVGLQPSEGRAAVSVVSEAGSAWATAHSYACVMTSHAENHEGMECPRPFSSV